MRKDFDRVLTEDPRRGSRSKFSQIRHSKLNSKFDGEFSGGKESMMTQRRNQTKQNRKTFGDHLNPLRRFINKQVGRKWDDVYSELCSLYDRRTQNQDHVFQHIFQDLVSDKTRIFEGRVQVLARSYGWIDADKYLRVPTYIHPTTGILCSSTKGAQGRRARAAERQLKNQKTKDAAFRIHSKNEHLYLENGVWMLYKLMDKKPPIIKYSCPSTWIGLDRLRWSRLSKKEQQAQGQQVFVSVDLPALKPPFVAGGATSWASAISIPKDRYYYAKQAASRKILKAHGLVGTSTL